MELHANWLDWWVLGFYLLGVFAFGLYMSRREETSTDFFLAGRRLPWYAISFSLFATNISSGSLVGLAGQGYTVGLAVGTLEWHATLNLLLLAFVFLPYYQRRSVVTIPEFLELRYGLSARTLFAAAVIIFDMTILMPFVFYTAGLVIEVMFGVPMIWSLLGIAVFVGVYTAWGGLSAVVWTDFVQAIFMVVGGVILTFFGLQAVGGWESLIAQAGDKMHVALPADHPEYPFPASMIGGYFLISIYYWCLNQSIVQRALGARSEWDGRMGAIGTCFIKLILPFIVVLPGTIAFVLFPGLDEPDKAYPLLVNQVVPAGLSGVIIAAVVAAFMSTASSVSNSWATVFTNDLYHRLIDPKASTKRLLLVGRLATVFLLAVAVIRAPLLRENESILQYFQNGLAYIGTPVVVIFMVGIFWRRATSAAAVATVVASPFICYAVQNMKVFSDWGLQQTAVVHWGPVAVGASALVMIGVSLVTRPKDAEALDGLIWTGRDTFRFSADLFRRRDVEGGEAAAAPGRLLGIWNDFRVVGLVVLVLLAGFLWVFR